MPGRGKIVIAAMFAVALAMGAYAWWAQYQKGRQTLEFWGPRSANLIRHAQHVEVLLLADPPKQTARANEPDGQPQPSGGGEPGPAAQAEQGPDDNGPPANGPSEVLTVAGQRRMVTDRRDISQVRGLVHARHSLVVDTFYLWDQPRGDCQADWKFALQFKDRGEQATLVFDPACARIRLLEQDREVGIHRPLSELIEQRHRTWAAEGQVPGPAPGLVPGPAP